MTRGKRGEGASRNRNIEKGGWTRTKVLDGRGDSPWNANSFRDNGHWAGGTSFANSRGAASRPRLSLSLSLSYQPYPHGRKGGGSTSSLDKFILAISSTNRDLVGILISSWLVLERCCRRMMPRVFWFLIFEACDGMNEVEMERVLVDSKRSFLGLHLMEEWISRVGMLFYWLASLELFYGISCIY